MIENFTSNYIPFSEEVEQSKKGIGFEKKPPKEVKLINVNNYEILDYFGIPSSVTLMTAESSPQSDIKHFKQKRLNVRARIVGEVVSDEFKDINPALDEPELHLKQMLPTFTPKQNSNTKVKRTPEEIEQHKKNTLGMSGGTFLDYEEALYFGDSKFA